MGDSYTSYVYDLARELGCGLRLVSDIPGMMYVEFGYVEGPTPNFSTRHTPQQAFAVCLHELGHFALGHTQGRPPFTDQTFYFDNGVLLSEAEAWDYTLNHMQIFGAEIESYTRQYMWGRCLNSYLQGAIFADGRPTRLTNGDRGYVEFVYDEPGEFFYSVRDRLLGEPVESIAA